MRNIKLLFLLLLLIPCLNFAQGEASAIFLLISPSPTMNGMGGVGVCLPSKDPFSGYYNPANGLELFEGGSISYSKMKTPWLKNLGIDDMFFEYNVMNVGIIPEKYPIKCVINYHKTFLDLGEQQRTDEYGNDLETFNAHLLANAFTIGAGYKGNIYKMPINISIGMTRKNIEQFLGSTLIDGNEVPSESKNVFYDYGFLFSIPYKRECILNSFELMVMPTFGYSISNVGGEIVFNVSGETYRDPSPRYARTGISATVVWSYKNKVNFFKWQGGLAASDLLVKPRDNIESAIKYQSGFGDINFYKNVIVNKASDLVTVHRGFEVTLLDLFSYRVGSKSVDVAESVNTQGYGLESTGLFNLLYIFLGNPIFIKIPQYVNVQYNFSEYKSSIWVYDQKFHSLSFTLNNIDKYRIKIDF